MIRSLYKYFSLFSLDVALGVAVQYMLACHMLEAEVHFPASYCLFWTVLWIYSCDHIIDVMGKDMRTSQKYVFYQRHFSTLLWFNSTTCVLAAVGVAFLPLPTVYGGIFLFVLVLCYFFITQYKKNVFRLIYKEHWIALAYASAVLLPLCDSFGIASLALAYLWLHCYILTFLSVLLFSLIDYKNDIRDRQVSLATLLGYSKTLRQFYFFLAFLMIGDFFGSLLFSWYWLALCYATNAAIFLIYRYRVPLARTLCYRYCIEANLFVFPSIYLAILH